MLTKTIKALYDDDKEILTLHICKDFEEVQKGIGSSDNKPFNVWVIDKSLLEKETFFIDDDVYSINPKDLFQYLNTNKKYIFIGNSVGIATVVECTEDNLINLLYWLSSGTEFYMDTYLDNSSKISSLFY